MTRFRRTPTTMLLTALLANAFIWDERIALANGSPASLDVVQVVPIGPESDPFSTTKLVFNAPIQTAPSGLFSITTISGTGNPSITSVQSIDSTQLTVSISGIGRGLHALSIEADLESVDGRKLDHDRDGVSGEQEDAFTATLISVDHSITSTDTTLDGSHLSIHGDSTGSTVTIDGSHEFAAVELWGQSVLTHPPTNGTTRKLDISAHGSIHVASGSKIDVSGKGLKCLDAFGNVAARGGSHGGLGSTDDSTKPNDVHGDFRRPTAPGSGGLCPTGQTGGGAGGGSVHLRARAVELLGPVLAEGGDGVLSNPSYPGAGGGAGGSVLIETSILSGTSYVSTNGGAGESSRDRNGGGGRIAIVGALGVGFDASDLHSVGGSNNLGSAAPGSVFVELGPGSTHLIIDSRSTRSGAQTPIADTDFSIDVTTLTIRGEGVSVHPAGDSVIDVSDLQVLAGAKLTQQIVTVDSSPYSLRILASDSIQVDSLSTIDVSGRGEPGNSTFAYTWPHTTARASRETGGGSYGGRGGGNSNPTYGDEAFPNELGSSGYGNLVGGSGGGLVQIVTESLILNGSIRADGAAGGWRPGSGFAYEGSGGSGGGILISTATLSGSGLISSSGGIYRPGVDNVNGQGGGGRIAVYANNLDGFDRDRITAAEGRVPNKPTNAQPGTVMIDEGPIIGWTRPWNLTRGPVTLLHGTEELGWFAPSGSSASIELISQETTAVVAQDLVDDLDFSWDTRAVSDGLYTLRLAVEFESGASSVDEIQILIINDARVRWHSGTLSAPEQRTWSAGVHVLEADVIIPPDTSLSVAPGAIVKAAPGVFLASPGSQNAMSFLPANGGSVIFTSLRDDEAGFETDGGGRLAEPGDWMGIASTNLTLPSHVEQRYDVVRRSGGVLTTQTWVSNRLYEVTGYVTIAGGQTLTLQPGTIVKMNEGATLDLSGGIGKIVGTPQAPIHFTSTRDDSVGGDSNLDGDSTSPAPGSWNLLRLGNGAELANARIRYGGVTGQGALRLDGAATKVSNTYVLDSQDWGIQITGGTEIQNTVVAGAATGVHADARFHDVTLTNLSIDAVGRGVQHVSSGTKSLVIANTTISDFTISGVQSSDPGRLTVRYTNVWEPTGTKPRYSLGNSADPGSINGNLSVNPRFFNPSTRDFRLQPGSSLVDAADGTIAPLFDLRGLSRLDDPATVNKGLSSSIGVPDIGAFEYNTPVADLSVTSVEPTEVGTSGPVSIRITGTGFTTSTSVRFEFNGSVVQSTSALFVNTEEMVVTADFLGRQPGNWDVVASQLDEVARLAASLVVSASDVGATVEVFITTPSFAREWIQGSIGITYRNPGNVDAPAPLLRVTANGARLQRPRDLEFTSQPIHLLAGSQLGNPDVLSPGEQWTIFLRFDPNDDVAGEELITFRVETYGEDDSEPVDWSLAEGDFRVARMPEEAWATTWDLFRDEVGSTVGSLVGTLRRVARHLSDVGDRTTDIDRLLDFLILHSSDFGEANVRSRSGATGVGRVDDTDNRAKVVQVGPSRSEVTLIIRGAELRFEAPVTTAGWQTAAWRPQVPVSSKVTVTTSDSRATKVEVQELDGHELTFDTQGSDGWLLLSSVREPDSNLLNYRYSQDGKLFRVEGRTLENVLYELELEYDTGGRVRRTTDSSGKITNFAYDSLGRFIEVDAGVPLEGESAFKASYAEGTGRRNTPSSLELGGTIDFTMNYDAFGRLEHQRLTQAAGVNPYSSNDQEMRISHVLGRRTYTMPDGDRIIMGFDSKGNVSRITDSQGIDAFLKYDDRGNPVSISSPIGTVSLSFDAEDRPVSIRDLHGGEQRFVYDGQTGYLSESIDSNGNRTTFQRDVEKRLTTLTTATGASYSYTYYQDGSLATRSGPDGVFAYQYDSQGRVIGISHNGTLLTEFERNSKGWITKASNSAGDTTISYDSDGNILSVTDPNNNTVQYTYDTGGLVATKSFAGQTTHYYRDTRGRVVRITLSRGGPEETVVEYFYLGGRLYQKITGDGTRTTYSHDPFGRLIRSRVVSDDGTVLADERCQFDVFGRITSCTTLDGTTSYEYDLPGRLIKVRFPNGRTISYGYDAAGNRTSTIDSAGPDFNYTLTSGDRYTSDGSRSFQYDAAGNLLSDGNRSFTYDAYGQVASVAVGGQTTTYTRDAFGTVIGSTSNGVSHQHVNDITNGGTRVADQPANGAPTTYIGATGAAIEVRVQGNDVGYYGHDSQGNVRHISHGSDVKNKYTYGPFGESVESQTQVSNPFTYDGSGGYTSLPGGLVEKGDRTVDASTGRSLTVADPIQSGNPYRPETKPTRPPADEIPSPLQAAVTTFSDDSGYKFISNSAPLVEKLMEGVVQRATESIVSTTGLTADGVKAIGPSRLLLEANLPPLLRSTSQLTPSDARALFTGTAVTEAAKVVGKIGAVVDVVGDIFGVLDASKNYAETGNDLYAWEMYGNAGATALSVVGLATAVGAVALSPGLATPFLVYGFAKGIWGLAGKPLSEYGWEKYYMNQVGGESDQLGQRSLDLLHRKRLGLLGSTRMIRSNDPNEIWGPAGVGDEGWIPRTSEFEYTILFENLASASAPAIFVDIETRLDANLEPSTLELSTLGWGGTPTGAGEVVEVPAGLRDFSTVRDVPGPYRVAIDVTFDPGTRVLRWSFDTRRDDGQPLDQDDVLAGFLPSNDTSHRGEGFVTFRVEPKQTLTTGDSIQALAEIVFDTNAPIVTNTWTNTIDVTRPSGSMNQLPTQSPGNSVTVSWTGFDSGSGVEMFDVLVSENGGAYRQWLSGTRATSDVFTGSIGSTYAFLALATDRVGNRELLPKNPETTTSLISGATGVVPPYTLSPSRRLGGDTRFETAATVANYFFPRPVPVVYLVGGLDFADALVSSPVAGQTGGPVLLASRDVLPIDTRRELLRLRPRRVVIVGGFAVIGSSVESELQGMKFDIQRVAGLDRFSTAAELSRLQFESPVKRVYVTTGEDFPDALSSGTLVGSTAAPLLLVTRTTVPTATLREIERLSPQEIVLIGGEASVSRTVAETLAKYAPKVFRVGGRDRYETSALLSKLHQSGTSDVVLLVTGTNFPDALSAVPAAVSGRTSILLTRSDCIPKVIDDELRRLRPNRVYLIGGSRTLNTAVARYEVCA